MAAAAAVVIRKRNENEENAFGSDRPSISDDILQDGDGNSEHAGHEEGDENMSHDFGADEGGPSEDLDILYKLCVKVKETQLKRSNYITLGVFLSFVTVYMTILYLQQQSFKTYQTVSTHKQLLPDNTFLFQNADDIYSWINDTILQNIYRDPDCGNGICSYPEEFPGFGRFGCTADCGVLQNVTTVIVKFSTDFQSDDDQKSTEWNLCMTSPAQLCWFPEPRSFSGALVSQTQEKLILPDGHWQIRIKAPHGGVTGQVDLTEKVADNDFALKTTSLTTWGECKPHDESRLALCRTACARFAVCGAMACSNIGRHDMASIVGDCYSFCNEDPEPIISEYTSISCYDVACAVNSTTSFLSVYKGYTNCQPELLYDGRLPDQGFAGGLDFDALGLHVVGFNASKPVKEEYCKAKNGGGASRRKLLSFDFWSELFDSKAAPTPERPGGGVGGGGGGGALQAMRADAASAAGGGSNAYGRVLAQVGQVSAVDSNLNLPQVNYTAPAVSPWEYLGPNDFARMTNLQVAVARALSNWPKTECTCPRKYFIDPVKNGLKFLGFFCAYLGGPSTMAGCNYTHPRTGRQITTLTELNEAMTYIHKELGFSFSKDEVAAFLDVIVSAIQSVSLLPPALLWDLNDHLRQVDIALINTSLPVSCSRARTTLPWHVGVNYNTSIWNGSIVKWLWQDDDAHSLREIKVGSGPFANFRGVGSGSLVIDRNSVCGPENSGYLPLGTLPPVPCNLVDIHSTSMPGQSTFSFAWQFDKPGVYSYEDTHFGSLMTGVVTVLNRNQNIAVLAALVGHPPVDAVLCAVGCPLYQVGNGQCLEACNVQDCNFDGGDCACFDPQYGSITCSCYPGQAKSGEGECCEPETVGTELLFDFQVKTYSDNVSSSSFLPSADYVKDRMFAFKNRLLVGMLIHQTRGTSTKCSNSRFDNVYSTCLDTSSSTAPYGVDPVFLETSDLYSPDLDAEDFYSYPHEFTSLGVPYGFFHHAAKGYQPGFSAIFDINLSNEEVNKRLQYLIDGYFIDNATRSVTVQMVTYNGDQQQFANTEVRIQFQQGGKLAVTYNIDAVSMDLYRSPTDWVRAVLEIILFMSICYNLYGEIVEWYQSWQISGRPLAYFDSFWNFIDMCSLALLFVSSILWVTNYVTKIAPFEVNPRYDVYANVTSGARFWLLNNGGVEFETAMEKFVQINTIMTFRSFYMAVNGISMFLIMLRVLKFLDFQPRMGIITRSLAGAASELLNFFLLLSILFITYSLMAHLVFGRLLDAYRTLAVSMVTNFNIIIGDNSVESELLLLQGWELAAGQIFFWTFVVFIVFILMNFLIAIVVDAFVEAKSNAETAPNMPAEVFDLVRDWVEGLLRGGVGDEKLLAQLSSWSPNFKSTLSMQKSASVKDRSMFADLVDRLMGTKAQNFCVRLPRGKNTVEKEGVEMVELDYPELQAIIKRCSERAKSDAALQNRRPPKKAVDPDLATRALFIRFGETPHVINAHQKVLARKKMGRDAAVLKGILSRMEESLSSVGKRLDTIEGTQTNLQGQVRALQTLRAQKADNGSASLRS